MRKIGVIGDNESVRGFAALGIDVYPAIREANIRRLINNMAKDGYAIPGNRGAMGIGRENVRKNVEKAVGFDIFHE